MFESYPISQGNKLIFFSYISKTWLTQKEPSPYMGCFATSGSLAKRKCSFSSGPSGVAGVFAQVMWPISIGVSAPGTDSNRMTEQDN